MGAAVYRAYTAATGDSEITHVLQSVHRTHKEVFIVSKLHPFTFRLDTQTEQVISNAAKAAHVTKSEFCRRIFMDGYKQLVQDFRLSQPVKCPPQENIATAEQVQELSDKIAEIKEEQERITFDFYNQRNMLTDIYIMLEALAAILGKRQEFEDVAVAMHKANAEHEEFAALFRDEQEQEARALKAAEGRR